ncbi:DNA-binding transcriptional LysR family regulator [Paenibacillus mucilaginosus]|uniref:LysR family transcriptional regulator n=1 Tax=Paenibacillus mucilaginosus TaxID=61624 RepID=UPI003D1AD098
MEWQQLEYFQTLARMQHVTRAAEALSLSQPALSRSIARLEEELGVPLFDRQGRTIVLNRYGRLFLNRTDRILAEYKLAKQELSDLVDPDSGEVALGFLHTLSTGIIPDLIGGFRAGFTAVRFQLIQNHSYSLLEHLHAGELDICLISQPSETRFPIRWTPLWSEEILVVLPLGHPLAAAGSIKLQEIADEPFIFLKKGYALRELTDRLFEQAGIHPRITFEGEESATAAGLVAAGLGISLLPRAGLDHSGVACVRLAGPPCERTVGFAELEGRFLPPAAERFKAYVLGYFGRLGSP